MTPVEPSGVIVPPEPSVGVLVEVIVHVIGSATWKSLKPVTPVACVLVEVVAPAPVELQFGESNFFTMKFEVVAPPSTSVGSKWNVRSAFPNALVGLLASM